MVRDLNITPDKTLLKKLGMIGYRTEAAIAELIDNSIDARNGSQPLLVNVTIDFVDKKITVDDDGRGMDLDELENALTIARATKRSKKKLGQFGMGMKSACSMLGKNFRITTAKKGSLKKYVVEYDEDEWLNDDTLDWHNFQVTEEKNTDNWFGTKIEIKKINVRLYPNQATNYKKHYGTRYASYLNDYPIEIKINQFLCKSKPIELEEKKKNIKINLSNDSQITGWIGLATKRSSKGEYGFNLFKNNRLIETHSKIGLRSHPEVSKVVGDLNFDPISVNFYKTKFLTDNELYKETDEKLRNNKTISDILSEQSYSSKNASSVDDVYSYLKGHKPKKILPLKVQLSSAVSKKILDNVPEFEFTKNSKNVFLDFVESDKKNLYDIDKSNNEINISINKNSPTFKISKNPLFLIALIQIESKLLTEKLTLDEFLRKRNIEWNKFINDFLSKEQKKPKQMRERRDAESNAFYGLSDELTELYDYLHEKFEYRFQFTALSTLNTYLEYGLKTMLYTIYVQKGVGEIVLDFISQTFSNSRKFALLFDPTREEIENAYKISTDKPFLIIREYKSDELSKPLAEPEKAWMDFYREIISNHIPITDEELVTVLDLLKNYNLVKKSKLVSLSKHRNNFNDVSKLLDQVFGESEF